MVDIVVVFVWVLGRRGRRGRRRHRRGRRRRRRRRRDHWILGRRRNGCVFSSECTFAPLAWIPPHEQRIANTHTIRLTHMHSTHTCAHTHAYMRARTRQASCVIPASHTLAPNRPPHRSPLHVID